MKNYRLLELAGMLNEDTLLEADSNAASLYNAAVKSGKRASASQEAIIANDPVAAYKYAKNVLKARWPAAEKTINMDARTAALYKRDVLREDNEDARQNQMSIDLDFADWTNKLSDAQMDKKVYSFASKFNCTAKLKTRFGPAGGNPEYTITGKENDLRKLYASYNGEKRSKETDEEFDEFFM